MTSDGGQQQWALTRERRWLVSGSDGIQTENDSGGLSRKFWSAKNFGPGSKIFGKIGPGGHCFSDKIGPDSKILVRCSL